MTSQFFLWLGVGFGLAGIIAWFRLPKEKRSLVGHSPSLEQRLKDYPQKAQAVIVRGDRKTSLLKALPWIILMVLFSAYSFWFQQLEQPQCVEILGQNAIKIQLFMVCYGLPLAVLAWSLLFARTGIKTLKTGYFPPLDSKLFSDAIAVQGTVSILRGIGILFMPLISALSLYFGNDAYTTLMDGADWQQTETSCSPGSAH